MRWCSCLYKKSLFRYSKQIWDQRPAWLPHFFNQREIWHGSLEKAPAGRDVLYHSDMVTFTELLSQQIVETVACTSVKAGFMICVLLPLLPLCLSFTHCTFPSPLATSLRVNVCVRVSGRQLLRCITLANIHRWIGKVLRHTVLIYGVSFILLLPSVFITTEHQGLFVESFLILLNQKPSTSEPLSFFFCFVLICHSAKGPKPPVATGGVEPWLHPAGLRWQHRHCAPFRPYGQWTLCHPTGNRASLSSLDVINNLYLL